MGTGCAAKARLDLKADDLWLLDHAKNIPGALMNAACAGWDMACRMLGECRFGAPIDSEFGDMVWAADTERSNWTGAKQFTYVRYDPGVCQADLDALDLAKVKAENVQVMDSVKHIVDIQLVGSTYAKKYVSLNHLGSFCKK